MGNYSGRVDLRIVGVGLCLGLWVQEFTIGMEPWFEFAESKLLCIELPCAEIS